LLCDQCERRLKEHEDYFSRIWFQDKRLPEQFSPDQDYLELDNLDYRRFKLFHLSILWRASVASGDEFQFVRLGDHEERLRQMLVRGDPGPSHRYRICGCIVLMRRAPKPATGVLAFPAPDQIDGFPMYKSIYAGCAWYSLLTEGTTTALDAISLGQNGSMILPIAGVSDFASLVQIVAQRRDRLDEAAARIGYIRPV
jgi:hypothetical protein